MEFPAHHILMPNGDDRTPTRESGVQVEHLWREANKELNGRVHETTGLLHIYMGVEVRVLSFVRRGGGVLSCHDVKKFLHIYSHGYMPHISCCKEIFIYDANLCYLLPKCLVVQF